MSTPTYPDLDSYRRGTFAPEDEVQKALMPGAVARGLPRISVNAEAGKALHLLARAIGAKKILEFGTLAGYSGIWLARALPPGGKLITLEYNPKHAAVARDNFQKAGVADRVEVRVGAALDSLDGVKGEAPFDFVFIDADKENYPAYLDFALAHLRVGGIVAADNANGHGHAHEELPEGDARRGIQQCNARMASDPNLVSLCLPFGGWQAVALKIS